MSPQCQKSPLVSGEAGPGLSQETQGRGSQSLRREAIVAWDRQRRGSRLGKPTGSAAVPQLRAPALPPPTPSTGRCRLGEGADGHTDVTRPERWPVARPFGPTAHLPGLRVWPQSEQGTWPPGARAGRTEASPGPLPRQTQATGLDHPRPPPSSPKRLLILARDRPLQCAEPPSMHRPCRHHYTNGETEAQRGGVTATSHSLSLSSSHF